MPRFQLLVRELGKEPRTIPLADAIVVGRSRSVDLTVDDEEVGRKQFRIGVTAGFVVLEGLGSTNPTRVDDGAIKAGEKTTLAAGATIRVGKTEFQVEAADATELGAARPSEAVDRTMVAKGPGVAKPPVAGHDTGDAPGNTIEFRRPGGPAAKPADQQPAPDEAAGNTLAKGFRPGAFADPQEEKAPAKPSEAKRPPTEPVTPPAVPAEITTNKPKTVPLRREDLPPPTPPAGGEDLESRLHQSMPRLFVKGEGLKRPVRLMKAANKVGRAETADVLLPHESVSEQHAEIRFDGAQWSLHDCGSTNGTVVDGSHLRGGSTTIRRNTLIGIGALQLVFLCSDPARGTQDRRDETRALKILTKNGKLDAATANEIRQMARGESAQSIAEIVLRDTALGPSDWAGAIAIARNTVTLLDRILRLFGRR